MSPNLSTRKKCNGLIIPTYSKGFTQIVKVTVDRPDKPIEPHDQRAYGWHLRQHRKAVQITLKQAAQVLAVNVGSVSAWERFKHLPSAKNTAKIIALIGFDPLQCPQSQAKQGP